MPIMTSDPDPYDIGTSNFSDFAQQYGGSMPMAGGGTAAPVEPTEPLVYLGMKTVPMPYYGSYDWTPREYEQHRETTEVQHVAGITKAMKKFDKMNFTDQKKMLRLLAIGGFAGSIALDDIDEAVSESSQLEARSAYMALLETASDYYMNTGTMVTPDDVLRSAIAYRLQGSGIKWDGDFEDFADGISDSKAIQDALDANLPQPGTYTTVQKSVDIMNPEDAKSLTRAMLQQELGRDPTQAEYEDFLSAIMAAERANPTTSKTTTKYVLDNNDQLRVASQNTVTRQGIGAEGLAQMAYEKAQSQPGWAEWQAMGTYAPALFAALGATVPGT